jgi:antitoxin component YwqK of YwqJK toxin-antitoxin module
MDKKIKLISTTRVNYLYSEEEKAWIEGHQYVNGTKEYDVNGNLICQKSFNRDQENGEHVEYRYNDLNQVIEELIFFDDDQLAETHRYEYDEQGRVKYESISYQEGSMDHVNYTYHSNGKLHERVQEDEEGTVESREVTEYDGEKLTRESLYDAEGELVSDTRHTYDEKGNLIETIAWTAEHDEQVKISYEYDEKGRRECTETFSGTGQIVARTTVTYDDKDNVIEMLEEDTIATKNTKITYDEKEQAVLQEEFNEQEELNHRIERTYDEEGQLIESLVYVDRHDQGPDQYYAVRVDFEFHDRSEQA